MKHRKYYPYDEKGMLMPITGKVDGISDSYAKGRSTPYAYCSCREGKDHESTKITKYDVKAILDDLHRHFGVKEITVNGIDYRWPMIIHDENCR